MKSWVFNPRSASSISFSSSDPLYVYHSHHKEATWPAHEDKHAMPDLTEAENLFLHDAIAQKNEKKKETKRKQTYSIPANKAAEDFIWRVDLFWAD